MVSISKSRFAVLKVEDEDDDSKTQSSGGPSNQNQSNSAAAKKKNKKKKQKEADESLRSLAFGRPTGRSHKNSGGSGDHRQGRHSSESENWDEWKRRDEETTQDMFERDLQQALLESRMDMEHKKETQKIIDAQVKAGIPADNKDGGKKKKKKDKPQTMSLEQFNQLPPETKPGSDDEEPEPSPPPVHMRVPAADQDPRFFDSIQTDVHKIVQKERIQEEYKKQYAQESAMASKYRDQLEKKDEEIAQLKARLQEQEEELKQVKKRNKQLCVILAQGEMKDKAQVLMQVDELTAVKDELTEQVSTLTADLEKERSKVHALRAENDKLKGKHSSK